MQYEVKSNQTLRDYLVNIEQQTCSCRQWQATGIPCGHSIGIIVNGLNEDPHTYAKMFYTLEAFNNTYARAIMYPHSNIDYSQPLKPDSLPFWTMRMIFPARAMANQRRLCTQTQKRMMIYWLQILINESVDLQRREN